MVSVLLVLLTILQRTASVELQTLLSMPPQYTEPPTPPVRLIAYDLQLQLPLSEVSDPDVPIFTGRIVLQFELTAQIGPSSAFLSEASESRAKITFEISELDHFENVSLVFSGTEIEISNVLLTDDSMEISVGQPVLFPGRYTLSIHRYKGSFGNAIYYRDAGEHAVIGSALFPRRASALFPTVWPLTNKALFSIAIVHPIGTTALTSSLEEGSSRKIDTNWQQTSFSTTPSIAPSMLCFVLLPTEYSTMSSSYTGLPMTVRFNRYRIQQAQAKHLLNTATQVMAVLKKMFSSMVPVPKLDLVLMHDVNASPSYGVIIVPEATFFSSDYANQIAMLANWMVRQWVGGLVVIADDHELCFQEDIASFIAARIVRRMTNDDYFRLAQYAKVLLTETIFAPGELLYLTENPHDLEIFEKCGLKGVSMLESLENLIGEQKMLLRLNELVYNSKSGSFDASTFYGLINDTVDDGIHISQLFKYWRQHGGLPSLIVDRFDESIKLSQEEGNRSVKSGFSHFYRVNYDLDTWRRVHQLLTQNATSYTKRERIQLVSDFCFFYASRALPEPAASVLRNEFIQLVRLRPSSFPLCDVAVFNCVVMHPHTRSRLLDRNTTAQLRKRVFDSFSNASEMECRSGAAHEAMNELCTQLYGLSCL